MTHRIAILPYGPSDSCAALRTALQARFAGNNDLNVRLLRSGSNSEFRGRRGDIVINYGNRSAPEHVFGAAHVINAQSSLNNAANKLNALNTMRQAGVSVVPFTTDRTVAMGWANNGQQVYARTTLNGHSGEGIVVVNNDNASEMPQAPLYTQGITGQRREWRIHVFDGAITHVQVKRRRNGYQEDPAYREDVRNHSTGWIYATENINPSQAVLRNAVEAVRAMGLDFGAVDVISYRNDAWVLEVNTAAGLQAETTMTAFVDALDVYISNRTSPALAGTAARSYNAVFTVDPLPPVAPEDNEVVAEDENFAIPSEAPVNIVGTGFTAPSAPAAPTAIPTTVRGRPAPQTNRNGDLPQVNAAPSLEDGYYLADILDSSAQNYVSDVIVWVASNRAYRHGWNLPLPASSARNFRLIRSVTPVSGNAVTF